MAKRSYPLAKVYGLLEPGPVVLVTTARKGQANIMTMSWHTMMEFEPPLIGCVISGRNASFDTLQATKECVINIPTLEWAKQVVGCRQLFRTNGRQVREIRPHAGARREVAGAADRGMLRQPRMPAGGYAAGESLQFLHS